MVLIWRALIDDPKRTVDAHFDAIMVELLKEMGGRLWRSRQAACGALADLIQGNHDTLKLMMCHMMHMMLMTPPLYYYIGRRWSDLRPHIASVWTMTLRAVDDIKETVRRQALGLARSVE